MHAAWIIFLFILGACIGSFLNVVVWRVPRFGWGSLIAPPSHCPNCKHPLAWYDNVPVLGWTLLRGRCRYCGQPISIRYPIVEFTSGALFAFYYAMFFIFHLGMTTLAEQWPIYVLDMILIASLLAVSLIDAELFIIPPEIPWVLAIIGIFVHAIIDHPGRAGSLDIGPFAGAMAGGGGAGLLLSIALFMTGRFKQSFPDGEPVLEIDEELYRAEAKRCAVEKLPPPPRPRIYTNREIRHEIGHEMRFLMPPMVGAFAAGLLLIYVRPLAVWWQGLMQYHWLAGMLGAIFGALIGGFMVWIARILGTLALGRVAMGLGDVHLMFGVGAIIGAGPVAVAFFLAPFAGLLVGLWGLIFRSRRELPYGPYLSFAAAAVLLIYPPIADYLRPGIEGLSQMIHGVLSGA